MLCVESIALFYNFDVMTKLYVELCFVYIVMFELVRSYVKKQEHCCFALRAEAL